jgi:hypothetical protein
MKKILLFITCFFVFFACKKYNDSKDDLSGDLYLRGRVFLFNDVTNFTYKPFSGKEIKIGYAKDSMNNFLMKTTSDSNGYFLFENLKRDERYTVFSEYEEGSAKYFARLDTSLQASADSSRLIFTASAKQNAVVYIVKDAQGKLVSGTNICMFTSFVVANDSCAGSTFQFVTDSSGVGKKLNIPATDYIVVFNATFGKLTLKARDTINKLGALEIYRKDITVR